MSNGEGKWDYLESPEFKEEVLLKNGWCKTYFYKIHGWDRDGWHYASVGQDREQRITLTKHDWLSLEDAYETQMDAWEE